MAKVKQYHRKQDATDSLEHRKSFLFWGGVCVHTYGMWNFLGQGSKPMPQ